jgi:hypothetical protein
MARVRRFRRAFYATREQLVYAAALDVGMKIGLAIMLITFALYISGLVASYVPFDDLPAYWSLPLDEYLQATRAPTGWNWLLLAHKGDYMNFVSIAFLSGVTVVCCLRIIMYPLRNRDFLFAGVILLEAIVLLFSASGLISGGH